MGFLCIQMCMSLSLYVSCVFSLTFLFFVNLVCPIHVCSLLLLVIDPCLFSNEREPERV